MTSAKLATVVTADVVGSKSYDSASRVRLQKELYRGWNLVESYYEGAFRSEMGFRITAGDEFQYICKNFKAAILSFTMLRAYLRTIPVQPIVTIRAAISTGEIVIRRGKNPYEMDGPAFHSARQSIENLKSWGGLTEVRYEQHDDVAATIGLFLGLMDKVYEDWTRAQAKVIFHRLHGMSGNEIADKLHVAPSTISNHLKRSNWPEYSNCLLGMIALHENFRFKGPVTIFG